MSGSFEGTARWSLCTLPFLLFACATPEAPEVDPAAEREVIAPEPGAEQRFLADQRLARQARREELQQRIASWPEWTFFEGDHYFLATPVDDPRFVLEALDQLDAVRARLVREFPGRETVEGTIPFSPTLVILCANASAYTEYGGPTGSSSYYWHETRELVFFDNRQGRQGSANWSSLQHIAVHEYFFDALGFATVPQWLLFGTAALYGGLLSVGEELRLDHFDPKFDELRRCAAEGPPPPLETFLAFDRAEFYGANEFRSPARKNLILAWSFAFFLETGSPERSGWQRGWGGIPERFVAGWLASGTLEGARELAFEGVDLLTLEAAWRGWIDEVTGEV